MSPLSGLGMLDPALAASYQQLQRQQAYAQALREQSLEPIKAPGMVGPVYVGNVLGPGLAALGKALLAKREFAANDKTQMGLAQQQGDMFAKLLRGRNDAAPVAQGAVADPQTAQPLAASGPDAFAGAPSSTPQPSPQAANPLDVTGNSGSNMLAMALGGPQEYIKAALANAAPSPEMKLAQNAGMNQGEISAALRGEIANKSYPKPTSIRGKVYADAQGLHTLPADPEPGFINKLMGDGSWQQVPVSGGAEAVQSAAASKALGAAAGGTAQAYDPGTNTPRTVPLTSVLPGSGKPNMQIPPAQQAQRDAVRLDILQRELAQEKDPANIASLQREIARTQGAQAPGIQSGPQTGTQGLVDIMQGKYKDLSAQNGIAQNDIAALQTVSQLAPKAIVGGESEARDYANSLLSLVPGIGERAVNAKTAGDLLDKYKTQIVARLRSASGMGTDAAQSMTEAMLPNRHMTAPAIQEAAANLIAQRQMTSAKLNVLQPHALSGDPQGYANKEIQFDAVADPRLWQMSMLDKQGVDVGHWLDSHVSRQDVPGLLQKYKQAKAIGALQ